MFKTATRLICLLMFLSTVSLTAQAPVITKEPSSTGVIEGQIALFSVESQGDSLTYQWYKNDTLITGATDSVYSTLPALLSDNQSKFKCIVSNGSGEDTSQTATLFVTAAGSRVTEGIQILYGFKEGSGEIINDNSGVGTPYDLHLDNPSTATWTPNGLGVNDVAYINGDPPVTKVIDACKLSNEITIELWITPAYASQREGARILTSSSDISNCNFSLLHFSDRRFGFRLRTSETSERGDPALSTAINVAKDSLTHIVYTRSSSGETKIYIDGAVAASGLTGGDFSNWDPTYRLQIANDFGELRDWLGTYYLVSIYSRALNEPEVLENYSVGVTADHTPKIIIEPKDQGVLEGQSAVFSVKGVGDTISYQWRKNGVDIPAAVNSEYTIPSVSLTEDGDSYSCVISNSHGSDTSRIAKLYVTALDSRVTAGQTALYTFQEGTGDTIKDVSGYGTPLNLRINTAGATQWKPYGLLVNSSASINSVSPASKISHAVIASGEFTFEGWIKPENTSQTTATIFTISANIANKNFTVNQEGNFLRSWLRTTTSTPSGILANTPGNSLTDSLIHVVYIHTTKERSKIFLNGIEAANVFHTVGDLSNWDSTYLLKISNQFSINQPWKGLFNLISFYNRALSEVEIQHNYLSGPVGSMDITAPDNLTAEANEPGKVELTWSDNSDNEEGFIVERKAEGFSFQVIDSLAANDSSFTDSTVSDTTNYTYRVRAFNLLSVSAYSNEASVRTLLSTISAPSGLAAKLNLADTTNVELSWEDNSTNESGFILERKNGNIASSSPFIVIDSLAENTETYIDSTVQDTTTYTYRIRAFNADTVSAYSNLAEITTPLPVELTTFSANSISGRVMLTWETASEINNAGFSIERSTDNVKFSEIGFIKGKGTTTAKSYYSFTDKSVLTGKQFYRLKQIDYNGSFIYSNSVEVDLGLPKEFTLGQNYPNPFNPSTTIKFSLPVPAKVNIKLYNTLGQEVATLINNELNAGIHETTFNAANLSSGVYFYRLEATGGNGSNFVSMKRMILIK